jgi:hypothetical protein
MNIKLQAVARTIGMFAIATLAPLFVMLLFKLDSDTLFGLFTITFFAWMIWVVYSINLGQLETEKQIKEMQERRSTMISGMIKDPE